MRACVCPLMHAWTCLRSVFRASSPDAMLTPRPRPGVTVAPENGTAGGALLADATFSAEMRVATAEVVGTLRSPSTGASLEVSEHSLARVRFRKCYSRFRKCCADTPAPSRRHRRLARGEG